MGLNAVAPQTFKTLRTRSVCRRPSGRVEFLRRRILGFAWKDDPDGDLEMVRVFLLFFTGELRGSPRAVRDMTPIAEYERELSSAGIPDHGESPFHPQGVVTGLCHGGGPGQSSSRVGRARPGWKDLPL
jgi:hypothetical protein